MRRYDQRKDQIESEALDGILLLKKEQAPERSAIAVLKGIGRDEWIFNIYNYKFQIKEGKNIATFFYFVLEKTWFIFHDSGNIQVNEIPLSHAAIVRNGTILQIGKLSCFFELRIIVRKEYKKLLVEIILGTMEKKMSLSKIYEKLSDQYGFSQEKKLSWKNSIRCVLSESKVFYKIPKETKGGRGCFWSVNGKELAKMDQECIKRCEKKYYDTFFYGHKCVCYTANQIMYNSKSFVNENSSDEYQDFDPVDDIQFSGSENFGNVSQNIMKHKFPKIQPSNYMKSRKSNRNIFNNNSEDYEIASFDGGNRNFDAYMDELSSDFSSLSVKQKKRRRK